LESVNGSAADLAVSVVGDDLVLMREKADRIAEIISSMPGSEGVDIEQEGTQDQLTIQINRKNAARYGINVSDAQDMIEAAIGGKNISILYEGTKRYDIVVRDLPAYRDNINEIEKMLIPAANGSLVPIK